MCAELENGEDVEKISADMEENRASGTGFLSVQFCRCDSLALWLTDDVLNAVEAR